MATLAHNIIPPQAFERVFQLACAGDRVSFHHDLDRWRDIFRVDLTRMFNNQKMKLECPKMAIEPGRNTFNTASYTYSNDVWDQWTGGTTTGTIYTDHEQSNTVASSTVTWTTWVRDSYVYYHDVETYRSEQRVEAVWSIWTDEATRTTYESVADDITEGLQRATEQMGRAFEQAAESIGNLGRRIREEGAERRARETDRITKMQKKREEAEAKAKDLLLDLIGENELAVYEETGRVFVKGRKHDYIVQKEGFVQQIQKDKVQDLCAHINKSKYPLTDNVVAMKLLIEADEDKFLKIANRHSSRKVDELPKAACM